MDLRVAGPMRRWGWMAGHWAMGRMLPSMVARVCAARRSRMDEPTARLAELFGRQGVGGWRGKGNFARFVEPIERLIEQGANPCEAWLEEDGEWLTALHVACACGDMELFLPVWSGVDKAKPLPADSSGRPPLALCAPSWRQMRIGGDAIARRMMADMPSCANQPCGWDQAPGAALCSRFFGRSHGMSMPACLAMMGRDERGFYEAAVGALDLEAPCRMSDPQGVVDCSSMAVLCWLSFRASVDASVAEPLQARALTRALAHPFSAPMLAKAMDDAILIEGKRLVGAMGSAIIGMARMRAGFERSGWVDCVEAVKQRAELEDIVAPQAASGAARRL